MHVLKTAGILGMYSWKTHELCELRRAVEAPSGIRKGSKARWTCITTINVIRRIEPGMWTVHEIISCLSSTPHLTYRRLFRRAKHQSCYKRWKQNKLVCKQLQNANEIIFATSKGKGVWKSLKLFTPRVCLDLFYYFQKKNKKKSPVNYKLKMWGNHIHYFHYTHTPNCIKLMKYFFLLFKGLLELVFNYSCGCNMLSGLFSQSLVRDYSSLHSRPGRVKPSERTTGLIVVRWLKVG